MHSQSKSITGWSTRLSSTSKPLQKSVIVSELHSHLVTPDGTPSLLNEAALHWNHCQANSVANKFQFFIISFRHRERPRRRVARSVATKKNLKTSVQWLFLLPAFQWPRRSERGRSNLTKKKIGHGCSVSDRWLFGISRFNSFSI